MRQKSLRKLLCRMLFLISRRSLLVRVRWFVYEGSEPFKVTVSNLGDSVLYYRLRYPFDMCLLGSEAGGNVLRPGESRTYSRLEVAIHGERAQGYYRTVIYSVDGSAGHFGLEVERVMD